MLFIFYFIKAALFLLRTKLVKNLWDLSRVLQNLSEASKERFKSASNV